MFDFVNSHDKMMNRPLPFLLLPFLFLFPAMISVSADELRVAGKTLAGWTAQLESENETVRLRAVKSLGPFKSEAIGALAGCLLDESDAVRYWAADHLGQIGPAVTRSEFHQQVVLQLRKMESENGKGVSLPAAFALCTIESPEKHLNVLVAALQNPVRGVACSSAEFLGKLGPGAKAALPALEKQFRSHKDYHVRGACQNAIRKIRQEPIR